MGTEAYEKPNPNPRIERLWPMIIPLHGRSVLCLLVYGQIWRPGSFIKGLRTIDVLARTSGHAAREGNYQDHPAPMFSLARIWASLSQTMKYWVGWTYATYLPHFQRHKTGFCLILNIVISQHGKWRRCVLHTGDIVRFNSLGAPREVRFRDALLNLSELWERRRVRLVIFQEPRNPLRTGSSGWLVHPASFDTTPET